MQMSRSALLAADCYVTRVFRVLLIVITQTILRKETGSESYVTMGVNTNKAACFWYQFFSSLYQGYY